MERNLFNYKFRENKRPLILLVGRSGSGKDYWIKKFGLDPVISYTTRPMREGEKQGVEHYFVSKDYWEKADKSNVVAWTFFHDNYYWATLDECEQKDVYVVDPLGVDNLKNNEIINSEKLLVIWIDADVKTLIKQMRKRGDNDEMIKSRLANDEEMFDWDKFNFKPDLILKADF